MTAPASFTVSGPEDILGYIPHSLGYWPADSLVALTLQGKRIGATLRVDLPSGTDAACLMHYAPAVARYLEADSKADGVVLAVFSGYEWEELPGIYAPLLAALAEVLARQGLTVRDAWFVGDRYWRDALCQDFCCCPWPGRSVEEIRDSRLNAELVYRGSSIGAVPAPALTAPTMRPPGPAEEEWFGRLSGRSESRCQFLGVLAAWKYALLSAAPDSLDLEQMAYLRAGLRIPAWRDAVLVMSAAGHAAALAGAERFGIFDAASDAPALPSPFPDPAGRPDPGPACGERTVPPEYGEVLLGLAPFKPEWKSLDALDRVLQRLAAEGGGAAGAASLTGRGWISWCRGRGSYAGAFLQEAMECCPGYRLAELLLEVVGRGTLCGWAGNPRSAWQKFDANAA